VKIPGIDLTPFMPLLTRGVQALERMADALEKANELTVASINEEPWEPRPAPEPEPPFMPDSYGRNEHGDKVLPPEPWGKVGPP